MRFVNICIISLLPFLFNYYYNLLLQECISISDGRFQNTKHKIRFFFNLRMYLLTCTHISKANRNTTHTSKTEWCAWPILWTLLYWWDRTINSHVCDHMIHMHFLVNAWDNVEVGILLFGPSEAKTKASKGVTLSANFLSYVMKPKLHCRPVPELWGTKPILDRGRCQNKILVLLKGRREWIGARWATLRVHSITLQAFLVPSPTTHHSLATLAIFVLWIQHFFFLCSISEAHTV